MFRDPQFNLPIADLLPSLPTAPSGVQLRSPLFEGYDRDAPFFRWATSLDDIRLNQSRAAFTDAAGVSHIGPDNVGFEISKRVGADRHDGVQRVGVFANHGEVESWIRWNWLQSFFGSQEPLSVAHFDGHGDEMRARSAELRTDVETDSQRSFFELAALNSHSCGISSFLASLAAHRIIDPAKWYFKSIVDSWPDHHFWYQEKPRFIGSQCTTTPMQFDLEVEHGVVSDSSVAIMTPDVADIDIDMYFYVDNPRELALAIKKTIKSAFHSPLVNIVTSPGWEDQTLAIALAKLHVELLQEEPNATTLSGLVGTVFDLLKAEGEKNIANQTYGKRGDKILYSDFAHAELTDRDEFLRILLLDLDDPEVDLAATPPDPSTAEATFYYKPQGTFAERESFIARSVETDLEHMLLPALRESPFKDVRDLASNFAGQPPTSNNMLVARAAMLPEIPGEEPMTALFEVMAPVDHAISKIAFHLLHNFGRDKDSTLSDMTLLLGVFKADDITERPLAIKQSLLGFFHVLSHESDVYSYRFGNYAVPLAQVDNWRGRVSAGIQGIFSDTRFTADIDAGIADRTFTVVDVANILEVDGGGVVRARLQNGTRVVDYDFSFARGQGAPELYAHAIINGFAYLNDEGLVVFPTRENGANVTRWEVADRDVVGSQRRAEIRAAVDTWQSDSGRQNHVPKLEAGALFRQCTETLHRGLLLAESAVGNSDDPSSLAIVKIARKLYSSMESWQVGEVNKCLEELTTRISDTSRPIPEVQLLRFLMLENSPNYNFLMNWMAEDGAYHFLNHRFNCKAEEKLRNGEESSFITGLQATLLADLPLPPALIARLMGFADIADVDRESIGRPIFWRGNTAVCQDPALGIFKLDATRLSPDETRKLVVWHSRTVEAAAYRDPANTKDQSEMVKWLASCKLQQAEQDAICLGIHGTSWKAQQAEQAAHERTDEARLHINAELEAAKAEFDVLVQTLSDDYHDLLKIEPLFWDKYSGRGGSVDKVTDRDGKGTVSELAEAILKYPFPVGRLNNDHILERWQPYSSWSHPFADEANLARRYRLRSANIREFMSQDGYWGRDEEFQRARTMTGFQYWVDRNVGSVFRSLKGILGSAFSLKA